MNLIGKNRERNGVTIINRIANFRSEQELRYFQYCVTKFEYPLYPKIQWILDYNYISDSSFYVYLTRNKSCFSDKITINATFSVKTSDGEMHILGEFSNYQFEENTVKEIKLKTLNTISYCSVFLFPNDTLTLRCHLWSPEITKYDVTYHAISRCFIEKISFPFFMKVDKCRNKIVFGNAVQEIQLPQMFSKDQHHLKIELTLQNFLSSEASCLTQITKICEDFDLFYCFKWLVQSSSGNFIPFLENSNYLHMHMGFSRCMSFCSSNISALNPKSDLLDSDGNLTFHCELKLVRNRSNIIDFIDFSSMKQPIHFGLLKIDSVSKIESKKKIVIEQSLQDLIHLRMISVCPITKTEAKELQLEKKEDSQVTNDMKNKSFQDYQFIEKTREICLEKKRIVQRIPVMEYKNPLEESKAFPNSKTENFKFKNHILNDTSQTTSGIEH